jgi:YYY domain-containing protein
MVPIEAQIATVVFWLVILKFCQITVYPYLKPALGNLAYGLAYPAGVLLLTLVSWYLGLMQLPVQPVLILFAALGVYALYRKRYDPEEIKQNFNWDMVFLAAFMLMLVVRIHSPGIIPSGEKFMDAAFLGSIMETPVIIPADPWYAGSDLSIYYYLGHWMMGVLGVLAGGVHTVVFNLMLPTVFGFAAVSAYALGILLLKRHKWIPVLVLLIPDAALIWYLASSAGSAAWWASTRVIENTINEYPLFSFLWGDPHAHVLDCFNQILFLCLLAVMMVRWRELSGNGKYLLAALLALSLGTMPAINSWDVMIYAGVYLVVAGIVWYFMEEHDIRRILPFVLVPVLSLLSYGPFLLNMVSVGGSSVQGFFPVVSPTAVNEFLGVYLFFVAVFMIYGFSVLKKYPWLVIVPIVFAISGYASAGIAVFCILLLAGKRELLPETVFGILGMAIVCMMEFIYLKDYMGDVYYRMNTVFKFGFCAWFILSASALVIIGKWIQERFSGLSAKKTIAIAAVAVICLAAASGITGISHGYPGGSLDGAAWLETMHPSDAAGIAYRASAAKPGDVVVEAAGDSYTYSGRVSVMTGLPVVIGWAGHEVGWRQGIGNAGGRWNDVRTLYENPSETLELMDKYNATYLFVGETENEKYRVLLPSEGLLEVFSDEGVTIYQRSG